MAGAAVYHSATGPPALPLSSGGQPALGITQIVRQGTLVLAGDGMTSYDLNSTAANWGANAGMWTSQNIEYFPDQENNGVPTLNMPSEPQYDVVMGTRGNWTYKDCADADYDPSFDPKVNENYLIGPAIAPGTGICVRTFDSTPAKTDGGNYALLVVEARTTTSLTVHVTVWKQGGHMTTRRAGPRPDGSET